MALTAGAQYQDDFSDGDITTAPIWSGEVEKFAVTAGQLELSDAGNTGSAYLVTFSSASMNASWEFFHRYDSNPSTSNRAEYCLMSDQADLSGPLNGYYLRVGEQSGTTDQLKLFRQTGSSSSELLATAEGSVLNTSDQVFIRIRVTRDDIGNWAIWADNEGGTNFVQLGSINDNTYNLSLFSGVRLKYTSSRSENYFFFDDFIVEGEGLVDSIAPELLQATVLSATQLQLKFSEAVDPSTAEDITNYMVNNGIGFPVDASLESADVVLLTFGTSFTSGLENELSVSGISDVSGNVALTESVPFIFHTTEDASFNDVVVTEIHASPQSFTTVPDVEFLEIHNRAGKAFQLDGWTIIDGSSTGIVDLPARIMVPGSYAVVCNMQYVDLFSEFGQVIGVDGFPSLNDSGDEVVLRDENGQLIFHVEYDDNWYHDNIKADGGWSLEMIDTDLPCLGEENWRASNDASGGSPAQLNSVDGTLEDVLPIKLIDIEVIDSVTIAMVFDEKIHPETLNLLSVKVDNGIGVLTDLTIVEPAISRIIANLPAPLTRNTIYTLTVGGIEDCNGNPIMLDNSLAFGLPVSIEKGDVVINEILFNPFSGNVDFIELYNISGKLLSTGGLIIAEADAFMPDSVIDFSNMTATSKLIFPNDFLVLTENANLVKTVYFTPSPNNFLEVSGMPNYPDDEGVVVLYRSDLTLLDQVAYSDDWHYALLDDENGVSLERISPDELSQDENNWHSAASSVGFATPAYMNSATIGVELTDDISISPEVFSPDGDGFEDITIITYQLDDPGYIGNIYIFDSKGRQIRHLVRNETLGASGFYKWDGTDENGEKARSGLFIVLVDLFDLNGNRRKTKLEIALTSH
ncbi:MAG: hypothetical protein GY751_16435 [Bacteroidetes bacterium]|nr:hypothetical protein [Bacteroidota bacterium]